MIDLNNFQSINLSQLFDSVKFQSGSGSGYHLVINFCIIMFYMLMILMNFSFVPQTFFRIFFLGSGSGSWPGSGFHYAIHWKKLFFIYYRYPPNLVSLAIWFLWKSKFCSGSRSGSGLWFYFGFQYQTYISYIEDTHQILFGSANSFESCVHIKSPRTYRQTEWKFFFACFVF